MKIDIITIFPDYFAPLRLALVGKAIERGLLSTHVHDLRGWTQDVHRTVDDAPYGGGAGMVMRPEPWWAALTQLAPGGASAPRVVIPTPSGRRFDHPYAVDLAGAEHLIFCCGRYEGIDQRVIDRWATDEISLGDYVLSGGEVAVLAIVEAVARLLPGMVGNAASIADDSFATGRLEGPVYTRPDTFAGADVPAVLRSGDHAAIAAWRTEQSLARTRARRPDLLDPARPDPAGPDPAGSGPDSRQA
ncbi:MAG TPA: tRNA (guanosine(37)-N1)-methyltransferase TrmD [Mycobacteriales bacterium]|jgi:tRNA (guanine37-N1)-methyltransferase|nr:tRNA (guanosine(37)-N1)-methyltransferase TrmD [Mycobacteriales bacterium]